jgi:hypothetical protein
MLCLSLYARIVVSFSLYTSQAVQPFQPDSPTLPAKQLNLASQTALAKSRHLNLAKAAKLLLTVVAFSSFYHTANLDH